MRYINFLLYALFFTACLPLNVLATQQGKNPFHDAEPTAIHPMLIQENELLSQGVKAWVTANGYKLFWNNKKDYLVYNDITLTGKTDDDILQALGELFFSENYGLVVKKYEKNRVVVIDEM
ncbi:toxin co-regulated pilus biosynthesis Q family protein [Pseudescherichia vulneris]|uniref:TcpQ domain-containing protein n=1 Tax=Pseudescherichia vulneris TaxID=566 RepID=UPI00227CD6B8|nr:TcpQ domain-containing protein [Pseudescherichia vulneris]WAH54307.1 toxin co-regulated pilus biosynthesis Q family protein [Pseudescherichia vulneris]